MYTAFKLIMHITIYQVIDMRGSCTISSCDVPECDLQALARDEDLMLHLHTQVTAPFVTDCVGC